MIPRLFKKKRLFKAVYNPDYTFVESGYVDENVIGYFSSIEEFKEAVLKRWPNNVRDVPVFSDETKDFVRVSFTNPPSSTRIVLREVRPVGFRYPKEDKKK